MKKLIPVLLAFLSLPSAFARSADLPPGAALVRTIEWHSEKVPPAAKLQPGDTGMGEYLTFSHPESKPESLGLWQSDQPGIQTKWYAVKGKIRYRGVEGVGYLDLWSVFTGSGPGEKGRYFSRTLANRGPLQRITGASDWREVFLPFDGTEAKVPPSGLELNLVLGGTGAVDIGDLQLLQFADAPSMWGAVGNHPDEASSLSRLHSVLKLAIGIIVLLAVAGIVVAAFFIRRRKQDERRRMRALDLA